VHINGVTVTGDLVAITGKVLSSLGEPTMQALFWELSRQGVTTNPDEFDITRFNEEMKKIFGEGANVFMEEIYSQFKARFVHEYGREAERFSSEYDDDANAPPVEKIQRILALKVMS